MNKNIWYISKYFAPATSTSLGGRGWLLVKGLTELGINPTVITSNSNNLIDPVEISGGKKVEEVDGVKLVWLNTYKYSVAKSLKRILSWFHFEYKLFFLNKKNLPKPDAIVVSSLSLLTVLNGLWLSKKYQCRLIFEVRDIWPLTITEEGGVSSSNLMIKFLAWLERLGYENSDSIIGTMPNLEAHVREVANCSTPVHCVPMGIVSEQLEFAILDDEYVSNYLSSEKIKIVHAGTVGITNALDVLFEAAIKLEFNSDIEFIIVGDGALKQQYIDQYGHLGNVTFAPKVDKNQVQTVLSHCDIVYFSTFNSKIWEYGQSLNKIIDYMLSAKPILASYSGFPSMINEAECGFFVPAENVDALVDKILMMSQLPKDELHTMGQKGKDWLLSNRSYRQLTKNFASILIDGEGV